MVGRALIAPALLCLALGGCVDARGVLRAGYAAVLVLHDRDGDGALDRSEVTAMVERALAPGAAREARRVWLVAEYMELDKDGDGRLTLGELVRGAGVGTLDNDGPEMAPLPREWNSL